MIIFIFAQLVLNKLIRHKRSWEYISVLCGIYMIKGGLLIGAKTGPAFYTSLLVILYYFGELCKNRVNAMNDEETIGIIMYFMYWFVTIAFYRSGHREDFTAI